MKLIGGFDDAAGREADYNLLNRMSNFFSLFAHHVRFAISRPAATMLRAPSCHYLPLSGN